ncbi:MAG: cell division protein SepF [Candidatus Margulisiibacteriota bacterium]|jgi:FtsZ-interacting cell division protein YlmF
MAVKKKQELAGCVVDTVTKYPDPLFISCARNALSNGSVLIIDLAPLPEKEQKALFDYMCGMAHAIGGYYKQMSPTLHVFSRSPVESIHEYCWRNLEEIALVKGGGG